MICNKELCFNWSVENETCSQVANPKRRQLQVLYTRIAQLHAASFKSNWTGGQTFEWNSWTGQPFSDQLPAVESLLEIGYRSLPYMELDASNSLAQAQVAYPSASPLQDTLPSVPVFPGDDLKRLLIQYALLFKELYQIAGQPEVDAHIYQVQHNNEQNAKVTETAPGLQADDASTAFKTSLNIDDRQKMSRVPRKVISVNFIRTL